MKKWILMSALGAAALMTATPAEAGRGGWGGGWGSSGGGHGSSGGHSSSGGATSVPEPAQIGLFAGGVIAIGLRRMRRRKN